MPDLTTPESFLVALEHYDLIGATHPTTHPNGSTIAQAIIRRDMWDYLLHEELKCTYRPESRALNRLHAEQLADLAFKVEPRKYGSVSILSTYQLEEKFQPEPTSSFWWAVFGAHNAGHYMGFYFSWSLDQIAKKTISQEDFTAFLLEIADLAHVNRMMDHLGLHWQPRMSRGESNSDFRPHIDFAQHIMRVAEQCEQKYLEDQ